MSVVPNTRLESADSLTLQTFGIEMEINAASQFRDIYSTYSAFWKKLVIRNKHQTDKVQYRTEPGAVLKDVQPNSELPIQGWGSYLQVVSGSATPIGLVEFQCVNYKEAMRK